MPVPPVSLTVEMSVSDSCNCSCSGKKQTPPASAPVVFQNGVGLVAVSVAKRAEERRAREIVAETVTQALLARGVSEDQIPRPSSEKLLSVSDVRKYGALVAGVDAVAQKAMIIMPEGNPSVPAWFNTFDTAAASEIDNLVLYRNGQWVAKPPAILPDSTKRKLEKLVTERIMKEDIQTIATKYNVDPFPLAGLTVGAVQEVISWIRGVWLGIQANRTASSSDKSTARASTDFGQGSPGVMLTLPNFDSFAYPPPLASGPNSESRTSGSNSESQITTS